MASASEQSLVDGVYRKCAPCIKLIAQLGEKVRRPKTIRFEIVSLVAIILVPLISVVALLAVYLANTKRQLIELELVDIANRVTMMADHEVASAIGMLLGLATRRFQKARLGSGGATSHHSSMGL